MAHTKSRRSSRVRSWSVLSREKISVRKHSSKEFRWRLRAIAGKGHRRAASWVLAALFLAALRASASTLADGPAPAADQDVSFRLMNDGFGDASPSSGDGCRLLLRAQGDSRYYEIAVNRRDNTVSIRKRAGELFYLTPEIPHAAPYDRWQDIRVSARDQADGSVKIEFYSGDMLLASATDDGTTGGSPFHDPGRIVLSKENSRMKVIAFNVGSPTPRAFAKSESPAPQLAALTPASAAAGGEAMDLALDGSGFSPKAVVRWNGTARPAFRRGDGRLIIRLSPGDVASPGIYPVTVSNPGARASKALAFKVEPGILQAEVTK